MFGLAIRPSSTRCEGVARPHRALAIVAVVEQLRARRPGEHHGVAVEPDAVRQAHGIERGGLERLVEAVHVDENVADVAGRRDRARRRSRPARSRRCPNRRGRPRRARTGSWRAVPAWRGRCSTWPIVRSRTMVPRARRSPACAWWRPEGPGRTTAPTRRSRAQSPPSRRSPPAPASTPPTRARATRAPRGRAALHMRNDHVPPHKSIGRPRVAQPCSCLIPDSGNNRAPTTEHRGLGTGDFASNSAAVSWRPERSVAAQCPSNETSVLTVTPSARSLAAPPSSGRSMTKEQPTTLAPARAAA